MTMNNRILHVLYWNIISNKRDIRRNITGMMTAFCIITIANCFGRWSAGFFRETDIMEATMFCIIGSAVAMAYYASGVCWNMQTKTTFINYTMLPATKAEKFFANVLYQTVVRLAGILVALVATDILQAIISFIYTHDAGSMTYCLLMSLCNMGRVNEVFSATVALLFVHSTFFLGGTFFRRHQFALTALLWIAIPFFFSILGMSIFTGVAYWLSSEGYELTIDPLFSADTYEALMGLIVLLLIPFNYWISYRLFCRSQVINNKFFN